MRVRLLASAAVLAFAVTVAPAVSAQQILWYNPIDAVCVGGSCGLIDGSMQRSFTSAVTLYLPLDVPAGLQVTAVVACASSATGSWFLEEWHGMDATTLHRGSDTFTINGCDTTAVTPFVPAGPLTFWIPATNNGMRFGAVGLRVVPETSDVGEAPRTEGQFPIRVEAAPNPFREDTAIAWEASRPGAVDVAVYDARGRRVRGLYHGAREAGSCETAWDGRDEAGAKLPAGVYFVRAMATSGESNVCRVVHLE